MIVGRIRDWLARRRVRCPVDIRFTYPATDNKPSDGEVVIEVFLGLLLPNEVESKMEDWIEEMEKIDAKKV